MNTETLDWLLEEDAQNPGVRYFTLVDLLDIPVDDPRLREAHEKVMTSGAVPAILAAQNPDGWWEKPGSGSYPKYTGTGWQIVQLAMLGADPSDEQVRKGCDYVLDHSRCSYGGFSYDHHPGGMIQCWQGNLVDALISLGWLEDERLQEALNWLACSVVGEGISPAEDSHAPIRYYRTGNSGPNFLCAANVHKPCAWGAVKTLLALGRVPEATRTPVMQAAIQAGVDFLLSVDPASAAYPTPYDTQPNLSWFRFGMPFGYVTDILQILEALDWLGYGSDPRLANAYALLRSKQDKLGRWKMEYTYNGKTWADIEQKGRPSKWVTLRAMRVLRN
jgi:hypothetical protein